MSRSYSFMKESTPGGNLDKLRHYLPTTKPKNDYNDLFSNMEVLHNSAEEKLHFDYNKKADPRGLDRWVWQLFLGKNNKKLHVITAYRPNSSPGPFTVYSQHR